MTDNQKMISESDLELEQLFAQAQEEAPVPSADFLTRLMDDAASTQAEFSSDPMSMQPSRRPWWKQLFEEIGGLPALGGLAACACAGVYFGFENPDFATTFMMTSTDEVVLADSVMSHALLGDVNWIEEG